MAVAGQHVPRHDVGPVGEVGRVGQVDAAPRSRWHRRSTATGSPVRVVDGDLLRREPDRLAEGQGDRRRCGVEDGTLGGVARRPARRAPTPGATAPSTIASATSRTATGPRTRCRPAGRACGRHDVVARPGQGEPAGGEAEESRHRGRPSRGPGGSPARGASAAAPRRPRPHRGGRPRRSPAGSRRRARGGRARPRPGPRRRPRSTRWSPSRRSGSSARSAPRRRRPGTWKESSKVSRCPVGSGVRAV